MAWNIKVAGTNFPMLVTEFSREHSPVVHVQNPVLSAALGSNVSLVWTASPSQRLTLKGRLLISGITTSTDVNGPLSPGTAASLNYSPGFPAAAWLNPDNIKVADGAVSNVAGGGGTRTIASQILLATNFGFTIASTSSVIGILVEIKERETQNLGFDAGVFLVNNQQVFSENKARPVGPLVYPVWPLTLTYRSYGSGTDLWGTGGLSVATVNSSLFGVALIAGLTTANGNLEVDHIRMSVTTFDYSVTTTTTLDIFEAAVRDGLAVDLIDDEGTTTNCYITKFQADRIQTVGTKKYSMVTLSLVKNG